MEICFPFFEPHMWTSYPCWSILLGFRECARGFLHFAGVRSLEKLRGSERICSRRCNGCHMVPNLGDLGFFTHDDPWVVRICRNTRKRIRISRAFQEHLFEVEEIRNWGTDGHDGYCISMQFSVWTPNGLGDKPVTQLISVGFHAIHGQMI